MTSSVACANVVKVEKRIGFVGGGQVGNSIDSGCFWANFQASFQATFQAIFWLIELGMELRE